MVPDRMAFARGLGAALAAPHPMPRVINLVNEVLSKEPVAWESEEQRLVRRVSERLDVASGDETQLLPLARNVHALLDDASSSEAVILLLELIAQRARVLGIFRKLAQGTISRTSLLSFVSEQRWPASVRRRVAALSPAGVAGLAIALEEVDINRIEGLLIT